MRQAYILTGCMMADGSLSAMATLPVPHRYQWREGQPARLQVRFLGRWRAVQASGAMRAPAGEVWRVRFEG